MSAGNFLDSALFAFLALFPILNPPAMAPVFIEMTAGATEKERRKLAFLTGKYTFFLLAGDIVL